MFVEFVMSGIADGSVGNRGSEWDCVSPPQDESGAPIPRGEESDPEDGDAAQSMEELALQVSAERHVESETLRGPSRRRDVCRARAEFCAKALRLGMTLTAAAAFLGISTSAASRAVNGR